MNPSSLSIIRAAANESLVDEEGQPLTLTLTDPVESSESDPDLSELLAVCSGFSVGSYDVSFTNLRGQGFDFLLPNWIELCGDGCGNFWVLEIPPPEMQGRTGPVWFVCHDPPAIVLVADSLSDFLDQLIDIYRRQSRRSANVFLHSWTHAMTIWKAAEFGLPSTTATRSSDSQIAAIGSQLGPGGLVHDTRSMKPTQGFSWEPLDMSRMVTFGSDYRVRGVVRE